METFASTGDNMDELISIFLEFVKTPENKEFRRYVNVPLFLNLVFRGFLLSYMKESSRYYSSVLFYVKKAENLKYQESSCLCSFFCINLFLIFICVFYFQ